MKQIYCAEGTTCSIYPLEQRKIFKNITGSIGGFVIVLIILLVNIFIVEPATLKITLDIFMAAFSLFLVATIVQAVLYYKYYFYNIEEDNIIIMKGIISRAQTTIPYNKIQNVFIDQDFLDRILGLYDVHMATADFQSALMAHIDGVSLEGANQIKALLLDNMKRKQSNNNQGV